jgi:glycerophosphoryl diester phosphodiesterase
LEAGLDGLELDVHRTRDGVPAIYHDFGLEGLAIAQTDWAELKKIAPWMPRLEEVFALADQFPAARLNLELKSDPTNGSDGRERILAETLKAWPGRERAWISSFDPLALIRLKRLGLELPMALLVYQDEVLELLPCLPVQGVHPHFSLLSQSSIADFKQKGLFVYTWTVNNETLARNLLEWGVDGLIGDYPEVLLPARG